MKTDVLIIIIGFEIGGAQNMVYELIRCMDRNKFNLNVLCYGCRIENTLTEKIEKIQKIEYLGVKGKITPAVFLRVLKKIDSYKPDVIHSHLGGNLFAIPWGILHRKPVIVTSHTKPQVAFSNVIPLLKAGIRFKAVTVVTVSEENQKLTREYFNLNSENCRYINNGINIDRFYKKEHNKFTFINVGRQDENKNQIAILRCFAELYKENPNILLYLLGEGSQQDTLRKEAENMGLKNAVIFTGNVGNTEDYYAVSDCYVQSSHREALPLTALEAMATGLPIISTDVGGMKDIVKESNGFLVTDGDEEMLLSKMREMLNMPSEKRGAYSKASYEIVKQYSAERMTEKYEQLYEERSLNK